MNQLGKWAFRLLIGANLIEGAEHIGQVFPHGVTPGAWPGWLDLVGAAMIFTAYMRSRSDAKP